MAAPGDEKFPPMTMADFERGLEQRERTIEVNKMLVGCGLDPSFVPTNAPVCSWPRLRPIESVDRVFLILLIEPQQEVRVAETLKSYRIGHYLPLVPHVTTRGVRRVKVTVYRPMMRGYLFVDEASCEELELLNMQRRLPIHGFLRFGTQHAIVSQDALRKIGDVEQELAKPKPIQSIWDVGEVVRINEGPFMGFNATITDLANGDRITVEVPFMKRAVPTSLDSAHLDKL